MAHALGYVDPAGESDIFIGLTYNGASGWGRPDGYSLAYLKWAYTQADYDSILRGQYPTGKIITRGIWMSYMWVDTPIIAHPFVCCINPASEGGK